MTIIKTIAPVGCVFALTLLLSACDVENAQQKEAWDKAADDNQSPVTSCSWQKMGQIRFTSEAQVDEAEICTTMQASLGRLPSVALLRKLSKLVFTLQVVGSQDSAKEISYQVMNIVEVRGQRENGAAIDETFETIAKIFNGSQGHVTPKDMNIVLRGPGLDPLTIDQQGMFAVAAMISEAKKANGE